METKQAQSYLSKNYAYTNSNNCEIVNSRKLINLLRECKIRAKNQHSQQQQQQQQYQQQQNYLQQQQHLLCLNDKNLQRFQWNLSKNTMFPHPRRRKLYEKRVRQGQNSMQNFGKMLHFTDNFPDDRLNAMKIDSFMLKPSVASKMWHE